MPHTPPAPSNGKRRRLPDVQGHDRKTKSLGFEFDGVMYTWDTLTAEDMRAIDKRCDELAAAYGHAAPPLGHPRRPPK